MDADSPSPGSLAALFPIMGVVFIAFLIIGIAMPVLPLHVADRWGGAKVALIFVIIEAAGQWLLWASPSSALALVGCALTGFGYSLVYPGFGVEAVRRAPAESRGLAMGAYTAFLDMTLGIASPALGFIAGVAGIGSVFLTSAVVVLCAAAVAVRLLLIERSRHGTQTQRIGALDARAG